MRSVKHSSPRGSSGRARQIVCGVAAAFASVPALAALGGNSASIETDRVAVRGITHTVTQMQSYDRHDISTADGLQLHEYADRSGRVFAVTWQGRAVPDLRTLLGQHYAEYASAARAPRPGGHHVFAARSGHLLIQIMRLQRGFIGDARVPELVPPGVSSEGLH